MNILVCYRNWMNPNIGGVQRVTDTLVKFFVGKGHNLFYLTFLHDENDTYQFPAKIYRLPGPVFFSQSNINYYHDLLFELGIDIIINQDSSNERSSFWLNTGKHSAKKISIYHTDPLFGINRKADLSRYIRNLFLRDFILHFFSEPIRFLKMHRKKREMHVLIKNSNRLVLLSDEFKKLIIKELRIDSPKIVSIINPCVSFHFQKTGIKKKQLLFVARMEIFHKRPDVMLKIWSHIQHKFPDWELLFLGDGIDRHKIEELALFMKIKNVRFEGFVDPLPYYQEASVICMTSDYEGFGMVLVEAMQFGLVPIVFNNWASLKDIINDQVTGILIETDNMSDYIAKLNQLLSDEELRKRISANAKDFVRKFDIETIGPMWLSLFDKLMKE